MGLDAQNSRGQIFHVSFPGGELSRVTNDLTNYNTFCLEITRDGKSLVALQQTTVSDVWVANADASDARQITSGEPLGLGLNWVGNRIAAESPASRWSLINADGSNKTPLLNDGETHLQINACPDGKYLLYTTLSHSGSLEVWRSDIDGSNPMKLASETLSGGICTSDSKSVVYFAGEARWRISINGGAPEKMDLPLGFHGYSPDGTLMVYESQSIQGGVMQNKMIIAPANGKAPLHVFDLPFGMQSPQFAPDGKTVAFMLTRNRATNIWEQPLTGGEPIQLTKFSSGDMFAFSWSQDGRQLAFSRGLHKTDVVMMTNLH